MTAVRRNIAALLRGLRAALLWWLILALLRWLVLALLGWLLILLRVGKRVVALPIELDRRC